MVAVLAIIALIVVAHQLSAPPAPAPAAVPPAPPPAELVVVLPGADGHRHGRRGQPKPAHRAQPALRGEPHRARRRPDAPFRAGSQERVRRRAGSIPARPASFLLYFITGTDQLTEESKGEFERMLAELRRRPAPDILVIGHTDRVGSDADNDRLSLLRAERVRASLVAQGIAPERIQASGRGEREPIVQTADGVDEPRNRRVEINVR